MTDAGKWSVSESGTCDAPPQQVWPFVGEAARWAQWTFLSKSFLEREGDPAPDGVGAIRCFKFGPGGSREQVLAWDPPSHLAYTVLSGGFPVRNYRADVYLEPFGGGTRITWSSSYDEPVRGTGVVLGYVLRVMYRHFIRGLAKAPKEQGVGHGA
ncbi:MAG TPA: SRPBCC family protein [Acidimicrobiales bacterium]|nr:SRPBCC family protein [Acidimicrobiales bacterium]